MIAHLRLKFKAAEGDRQGQGGGRVIADVTGKLRVVSVFALGVDKGGRCAHVGGYRTGIVVGNTSRHLYRRICGNRGMQRWG